MSIASADYFTYGKFEVIADVPDSPGLQPAIWLQGENKNQYGEIDIMEAKGDKSPGVRYATIHAGKSIKELQRNSAHSNLGGGYHKYTAEWTPEDIKIYYDDNLILVASANLGGAEDRAPLKQPMQLKINLGGGSRWVGPINLDRLPQRMRIKSIKVWNYLSSDAG
ncbi:glycoside hydrolase family 16 protein [Pseudomonas juntendi]|uniref:glycoside hydrolase family 16 protein n=1 Tax=Pseudomonas juntendi TaxID=2666183 RepID=UPI002446FC73|nr:glycoside hydrolase family 16 protein [Pseudomonas juntendi]MDH2012958.1 glycoside hydrolase family 16 protein [Pseudomonas juntendi]